MLLLTALGFYRGLPESGGLGLSHPQSAVRWFCILKLMNFGLLENSGCRRSTFIIFCFRIWSSKVLIGAQQCTSMGSSNHISSKVGGGGPSGSPSAGDPSPAATVATIFNKCYD